MQLRIHRHRAIVLCAAAALVAGGSSAIAADAGVAGMIKRVTGTATVERANVAMPATAGMLVHTGDRIVTGRPGGVGLVLADDSIVTAGPDSRVELSDVKFDPTSHEGNVFVRLLKGALHYVTGLVGKHAPGNVKVETPTAVMGVRGTEFIVETAGVER
jgi:hypothetical protein